MGVLEGLEKEARGVLPKDHPELGDLVAIDGSLIDATFSMAWADYRKGVKKAKVHMGFNLNQGVPSRIFLTKGKEGERPFVGKIVAKGETAVIGDTRATRTSMRGRQRESTSSAGYGQTRRKRSLNFVKSGVSSFTMPSSMRALPASTEQKSRSV